MFKDFTSDFLKVGPTLEEQGTSGPVLRVLTSQRLPLPQVPWPWPPACCQDDA